MQAAQGSAKEETTMIYYRVKPEKYNVPKRKKGTEGITEPVNIKPKETYWFFGARFQDKEE